MVKKIIYGNTTLLDLTNDTVTEEHLEQGYTAHDANGDPIVGNMTAGGVVSRLTISPIAQPCTCIASIGYTEVDNEFGGKTFIFGGSSNGV